MRAHNGSDAVAVRRARFFQARPRRIEIKTSQLFRMPQAHHGSCDEISLIVTESAADGCLATTNASGAQSPEHFGKKEKAARLAFSTRF